MGTAHSHLTYGFNCVKWALLIITPVSGLANRTKLGLTTRDYSGFGPPKQKRSRDTASLRYRDVHTVNHRIAYSKRVGLAPGIEPAGYLCYGLHEIGVSLCPE